MEAVIEKTQTIAKKAKEGTEITKYKMEVKKLELKIAREFAELGNKVYELYIKKGEENPLTQQEVKQILEEITNLDRELAQTQAILEKQTKEEKKPVEQPESEKSKD
jgi:hypothetical protein